MNQAAQEKRDSEIFFITPSGYVEVGNRPKEGHCAEAFSDYPNFLLCSTRGSHAIRLAKRRMS